MPHPVPDPACAAGLYLHLGAHRTGTGSFQAFLAANLDRLRALDLNPSFSNRDGGGDGPGTETARLRLPAPRHFASGQADMFDRDLKRFLRNKGWNRDGATLVSEENLIGALNAIFNGPLYQDVGPRLRYIARHLTVPVQSVVLVVRSYDSFFGSAYRKRLEFRALHPFSTYAQDLLPVTRGWPEVVGDIQAALNPVRMVVLQHEHRLPRGDILFALCPSLPRDGWVTPQSAVNFSANDSACFALLKGYAEGRRFTRTEVAEVIAAHHGQTSDQPLIDLPRRVLKRQQDRYAQDLDTLRTMPGVTVPDHNG